MVEIRQAENDLPGNRFLEFSGHASGLLCRRHVQNSMHLLLAYKGNELDERTGDLSSIEVVPDYFGFADNCIHLTTHTART
jgi:hypothetical protein